MISANPAAACKDPEPRYMATPFANEVKEMVAHLHDAGIEVILDVVYNHTAEGNEMGPTLSFKGIDNASYYRLLPDRRYYINETGTGNTLNVSHPPRPRHLPNSRHPRRLAGSPIGHSPLATAVHIRATFPVPLCLATAAANARAESADTLVQFHHYRRAG